LPKARHSTAGRIKEMRTSPSQSTAPGAMAAAPLAMARSLGATQPVHTPICPTRPQVPMPEDTGGDGRWRERRKRVLELNREAARQTQERLQLDEYQEDALSRKLSLLLEHLEEEPEVQLSYFKEDARKAGGEYVKREGRVKKIDLYGRVLVMEDGTKVPLDDLFRLDGALFTE